MVFTVLLGGCLKRSEMCRHPEQEVRRVENGWEIYCLFCDAFLGFSGFQKSSEG